MLRISPAVASERRASVHQHDWRFSAYVKRDRRPPIRAECAGVGRSQTVSKRRKAGGLCTVRLESGTEAFT
jgi:hypothetical protein